MDRRALEIEDGARVVVVAGAGDRALDAVVWGAGEVTAVDLAPSQLRLSALKIAAAGTLDTADLVALFAVGRRPGVRRLYRERLRPRLEPADRRYWDRHIAIFELGLHQHHPLGLTLLLVGWVLRLVGSRELRRIIATAPDASTQARWYEQRLRARYWNRLTRWLMSRATTLRWVVVHPGERDSMLGESFAEWLEARVSRSVEVALIRENPYWMPLLGGRTVASVHEDAWLRPDAIDELRRAPEAISLRLISIVDHLEAQLDGSVDAVGLSNVPDWLGTTDLERLWAALARVLAPGGRAVLRSAYRTPPLPSGPAARLLQFDHERSAELLDLEQTGLYANVCLFRRVSDGQEALG